MWETFIWDFNSGEQHWDNKPQIGTNKFDLIHYLAENGLWQASGPVHAKHPIRYINIIPSILFLEGGIPPPSRGIVGKNRSKTTVRSKRVFPLRSGGGPFTEIPQWKILKRSLVSFCQNGKDSYWNVGWVFPWLDKSVHICMLITKRRF